MNGGGLGFGGVYFSSIELLVIYTLFVFVALYCIYWLVERVIIAYQHKPIIKIYKPSNRYWKEFDEMQTRLMWHLKGGNFEDDRSMLNWALQEIYFLRRIQLESEDDDANIE